MNAGSPPSTTCPTDCRWRRFPCAATAVSLAGIGPRRTTMRIVCDPGLTRNVHEVEAVGEFGRSFIRIENVPSENPRTGILTFLSTIALLRGRRAPLVVGT